MTSETDKGTVELAFFEKFARVADIGVVPGSGKKALPPAPDIFCALESGENVAFELAEACAPEFNAAIARAIRDGVCVAWGEDVSDQTIRNKLRKRYVTPHPIELLLYRNAATALTDEVIVLRVRDELASGLGPFRRVWYLGDSLHRIAEG